MIVQVDADFSGGNIIVDRIDGDTLYVRQDLRDTEGRWFYWCCRVRGAAGRTLHVRFPDGNVVGVRGPAVSTDGGASWRWLADEAPQGAGAPAETRERAKAEGGIPAEPGFTFAVPAGAGEVRFGAAIPYVTADLEAFLKGYDGHPNLRRTILCTSRAGRPVERLALGCLDAEPDCRLLLTCRHHACEAMASYVLEGIVEAMLAEDATGAWFRRHAAAFVVPFVDKDGVEAGDQGKNRRPRDHNRDYAGESLYPEVRAVRAQVPAWCGGTPTVMIDLHCPGLRGEQSQYIYMVGSVDREIWRRQQRLGRLLEATASGLPYLEADDLPYGQGWNTEGNYTKGRSSVAWGRRQPAIELATTLEIPYAEARGVPVTPAAARRFGRDLLRAVRAYFAGK